MAMDTSLTAGLGMEPPEFGFTEFRHASDSAGQQVAEVPRSPHRPAGDHFLSILTPSRSG